MQNDFDRFYRGLNFIIAGLIFCIVDINLGSFDILPDILGAGFILFALWEFSKVVVNEAYKSAINLAMGAALVEILLGVVDYVYASPSEILSLISTGVKMFVIYGLIMFAKAMQIYAEANDLGASFMKWKNVEKLYLWMYFIALGVLSFAISILTTFSIIDPLTFSVGFLSIPILLVTVILLLFPLVQTIRVIIGMKREMLN
ncbi:MAG: hypothetical protein AB8H47_25510 [Bacteroidia bacterium]